MIQIDYIKTLKSLRIITSIFERKNKIALNKYNESLLTGKVDMNLYDEYYRTLNLLNKIRDIDDIIIELGNKDVARIKKGLQDLGIELTDNLDDENYGIAI